MTTVSWTAPKDGVSELDYIGLYEFGTGEAEDYLDRKGTQG